MSSLIQLNNALFAELERLEALDTSNKEECEQEIRRANAINKVATSIISNGNLITKISSSSNKSAKSVIVPKGLLK